MLAYFFGLFSEANKDIDGIVREDHHILILGWNEKVGGIIRLLAEYRKNLKVVIPADTLRQSTPQTTPVTPTCPASSGARKWRVPGARW